MQMQPFFIGKEKRKFKVAPFRAFDAGNSASICTTLIHKSLDSALEFTEDTYARYFELTHKGQIVDGYSYLTSKRYLSLGEIVTASFVSLD